MSGDPCAAYGYVRRDGLRLSIDGVLKATVHEYGSAASIGITISGLSNARHAVKVVVVGTKAAASVGKYVTLDRFAIS